MGLGDAERDRGRSECDSDIANGRLKLYGQTRGAWGEYMSALMKERFDLVVVHAGDLTTDAELAFHGGYNERVFERINSTFGDGSIEDALAAVEAFRERRYREFFRDKD